MEVVGGGCCALHKALGGGEGCCASHKALMTRGLAVSAVHLHSASLHVGDRALALSIQTPKGLLLCKHNAVLSVSELALLDYDTYDPPIAVIYYFLEGVL